MIISHDFACKAKASRTRPLRARPQFNQTLVIESDDQTALPRLQGHIRDTLCLTDIEFMSVGFSDFSILAPSIVYSPLFTSTCDALDIAEKLQKLDFTGSYIVVGRYIPDAAIISAEIELNAPKIDLEVVNFETFKAFGSIRSVGCG